MFDFAPDADLEKPELYRQLSEAAAALIEGESDKVANMANVAALMAEYIPQLNWVGFYRVIGDELVLGPFVGRPACIRIPLDQGVCGEAVQSGETQLVEDVHAFPGHIACDANSRSELVVPVRSEGVIVAIIDLDSPEPARFGAEDAVGIEKLAALLADRL